MYSNRPLSVVLFKELPKEQKTMEESVFEGKEISNSRPVLALLSSKMVSSFLVPCFIRKKRVLPSETKDIRLILLETYQLGEKKELFLKGEEFFIDSRLIEEKAYYFLFCSAIQEASHTPFEIRDIKKISKEEYLFELRTKLDALKTQANSLALYEQGKLDALEESTFESFKKIQLLSFEFKFLTAFELNQLVIELEGALRETYE